MEILDGRRRAFDVGLRGRRHQHRLEIGELLVERRQQLRHAAHPEDVALAAADVRHLGGANVCNSRRERPRLLAQRIRRRAVAGGFPVCCVQEITGGNDKPNSHNNQQHSNQAGGH